MKTPGPYEATVLCDSISPDGVRLTTLCCTFPRIVLAEFNTHRVFSRNSASSRAIPVKKRIEQIRENPYIPLQFGKNKSGMQAQDEEVADAMKALDTWLQARDQACDMAEKLADIGLHKQWANRLIEPFAWHTVICSATEWANYWALRISKHAQPEICEVSRAMKVAMDASNPNKLDVGEWHTPLIYEEDVEDACTQEGVDESLLVKLSTSRCASVSYERHMERNTEKDLQRHDILSGAGHMSPFEHAAMVGYCLPGDEGAKFSATPNDNAWSTDGWTLMPSRKQYDAAFRGPFIGNFRAPWIQYRKLLPNEAVFKGDE